MASNVYVGTSPDGENNKRVVSYSDRSSPYSADLTSRYKTPASPTPPRTIRSAGYNGGTSPEISRQAQYKARERQLMSGLPNRTSAYERERDLRNAQVGAPGSSYMDSKLTKSAREAAMDATHGQAARLQAGYDAEDQRYTDAYTQLTGRQDTAQQLGYERDNKLALGDQRNQGAYDVQGLQNKGYLDSQLARNEGALAVADLQGMDRYALQNAMEGGQNYRADLTADLAGRRLDALYGAQGGKGGLEHERLKLEQDRADQDKVKAQRADLEKQINVMTGGRTEINDAVISNMTPEQKLLPPDQRRKAIADLARFSGGATLRKANSLDGVPLVNWFTSEWAEPGEAMGAEYDRTLEGFEGFMADVNPFNPYGSGDRIYRKGKHQYVERPGFDGEGWLSTTP